MMKALLILSTLILGAQLGAQVPFANALQMPLSQNPAFAGNKNKHRIQCAWNNNGADTYKNKAYYLSYDNFAKKLRIGYGVYGLHTFLQAPSSDDDPKRSKQDLPRKTNGAQYDYFKHDILREKFPDKWSTYKVGICLASKHNVNKAGNAKVLVGTISPALSIALTERRAQYVLGGAFTKRQWPDTFFVDQDSVPHGGLVKEDSLSYTHQTVLDRGFVAQLGLKYNNKNFMIMYSFGYGVDYTEETNYLWATMPQKDYIGPLTHRRQSEQRYRHRLIEHKLAVGYSYPKDPDAVSGVTFFASIGTKRYKMSSRASTGWGHATYKENQIPLLSQLHLSSVYRYKMLLFNASYTRYDLYHTYGLGMGFQSTSYRCMATCFPMLKTQPSTLEFTLGVFI